MKIMKKKLITLVITALFLLGSLFFWASCTFYDQFPDKKNDLQSQLTSGKSGLYGYLTDKDGKTIPDEVVKLASVVWSDDNTQGSFIIDGANSPSTYSKEDGSFLFININPGEYVIVVRNVEFNPIIIPKSPTSNEAAIYTTIADELLNVGTIQIDNSK